jgi:hypothetical protein
MAIEFNPSNWDLTSGVGQRSPLSGLATVIKQPTTKEITTSPLAALAAKKAAAAKTDEFKMIDVNPTNPIPEDQSVVDKELNDFAIMQADFKNKGYTAASHPTEYAAIQQKKQKVENTALYSNEYGKKEADFIKKIQTDPYRYPPNAIDIIMENRALPLFNDKGERVATLRDEEGKIYERGTRELDPANLFPKIDNINVAKEVKLRGYDAFYRKSYASWNGSGGGSSKSEFIFDDKEAERSYEQAVAYDGNKGYMVKMKKRAFDNAESEYDKQQRQANTGLTWADLTETEKDDLVETKRKDIYIQTLRDLAKDDIANVNKANRIYRSRKSGGGDGQKVGARGFTDYLFNRKNDGTWTMSTIVNIPPVATESGADSPNPLNVLNDANSKTMPYKVEFTGKVKKIEGGIWMMEYMALEKGTDLQGKEIKQSQTYWTPYEPNRALLKKFGYKDIDEVEPPAERAEGYKQSRDNLNTGSTVPTPDDWNKNHPSATQSEKDEYKKWYDKNVEQRKKGWKNTSNETKETAERKRKAEEAITDQVASLTNQEKKIGTYNPSTGQIDFA